MSPSKPESGEHPEHEERLAKTIRAAEAKVAEGLEKAVAFERADMAETEHEWSEQLHNDGVELRADVVRDKERVREALDDVQHPERIAEAAGEKLAQVAEGVRGVARAVGQSRGECR